VETRASVPLKDDIRLFNNKAIFEIKMGVDQLGERYGRELGGSHLSGIDSLLAEHQPP